MPETRWEPDVRRLFDETISKMPMFHRRIAERLVKERAELLTQEKGLPAVTEEAMVVAFFQEAPPAFKGMLKKLLHDMKIDYTKYVQE